MSQNKMIEIEAMGSEGTGKIQLVPLRSRNGVFEYAGRNTIGTTFFSTLADTRLSASVRQGTLADKSKNVARIKQRVTLKIALPVTLSQPGDEGHPVIDYVNVDTVVSSPVGVNQYHIAGAVNAFHNAAFVSPESPLLDLLVYGREPF